ncbi:hypothetical protein ANCCAN_15020 [Ancylostoma caninum]|uniref:FBXO47 ARM repeats region domain-containing protein n=1 Tax=Ancylostoma caninum TaxID=29170 RepID=A0A368G3S1_ANCCA|nr:hypothetical protein ANCCAN_15020 [Ancylostoma caninum]
MSGESKITCYFPVRKRGREDASDVYGKRLRRGVMISDVGFASPAGVLLDVTPLRLRCLRSRDELCTNTETPKCVANSEPPETTPFGAFGELPVISYFSLFDSLDVPCLSSLSMTSSAWTSHLVKYIHSNAFLQRVERESAAFSISEQGCKENFFTIKDPFYCYGKLLKSVSVCFPTLRRVAILTLFCQKAIEFGIDSFGIGRVIHTMCSKWAFSECAKILDSVLSARKGRLRKILCRLHKAAPGSLPEVEMELRDAFVPLLLSGRDAKYEGAEVEYAFWLSAIMRCYEQAADQSKLLMILFGPTTTDSGGTLINWQLLCDHTIMSQSVAEELLKPLSDALHVLMTTKEIDDFHHSWTQHDVFNVIEELSTTPEPWSFENFVSLLLFRPTLIPISLTARLENNYADEACLMFNTFAIISYRWSMDVCRVIRQPIMQTMRALTRERGRMFYNEICETYARQLKQASLRGQGGARDLSILMASHAAVSPVLQLMSESLW